MKFSIRTTDRARKLVEAMDITALIEQVLCPSFMPCEKMDARQYGAAFFHADNRESLETSIARFKEGLSIPPFVTTDMENGPGEMIKGGTQFPSMMGAGAAGDESLVYEMGRAAAAEGRAVGFNWTLAPSVDIASIPDSPVVSFRSPGRDADTVIRTAGAYIKGLQDYGMVATIKHFPGDGFDIYDQHLTTPRNPLSMDEWREQSGRVFRELIEQGVMAVMPGHISLPAYDQPEPGLDLYPPATLSKRLMVDLLRGELGFDGLIVSDAVNMGGMAGFTNYFDACALFLARGGDCVLFPEKTGFVEEMVRRVESGMLPFGVLRDRALRIVSMKDNLGLFEEQSPVQVERERHEGAARQIASKCVEIVRDRARTLPLKIVKQTRLLHLVVANNYGEDRSIFDAFTARMKHLSDNVVELVDPGPAEIFKRVLGKEFDAIICSVCSKQSYGTNVTRLHGPVARNMMGGWMRLGTPVVFVAHYHPFIHLEYEAAIDTIINAYGSTVHSVSAVLDRIVGR